MTRPVRGKPYYIEEFWAKYALDPRVAEALFSRFGTSSVAVHMILL